VNPFRALDERVLPRLGRGLHRLGPVRVLVVLLCVVVIGALALWDGTRHRAAPDETVGDVARVGVVDGEGVPAYLARSRGELNALSGSGAVWALVGFDAYTAPQALDSLLAGDQVGRVIARVPLPGVQTQVVTLVVDRLQVDVRAGMLRVAAQKRKEESSVEHQEASDVVRQEAAAYARLCACLYAAVVRATPVSLESLAGRVGIRVVDPAPEVTRLDRAVFVPLLPEQQTVVAPPPDVTDPGGVTSPPS
jgi:hypothetical protein